MFSNIRNRIESAGTIKTLCELAEAHASRDEKRGPGAEHFVLAAIDLPDETAKLAFANAGSDATSFKWAIQRQYEDALRDLGLDPHTLAREAVREEAVDKRVGVYSAAPSGRELMQDLASNSKSHQPLLGAHVVAVVANLEHGVAARALAVMGVERAALKLAAKEITRTFSKV